jgi:uncharacterized protein YdaU (DUF1376 family)
VNYYPHHIGDFNSATRHLTRIERSIYRDMIEMYYDTEQPLPRDRAALCRKLMARSEEELTAVEQVLNEFFTDTDQGWFHDRCDAEILAYHKKLRDKSEAGKASAAARASKTGAPKAAPGNDLEQAQAAVQQVLDSCSTNQEPITNNHKPEEKQKAAAAAKAAPKFSALDDLVAKGVDLQTASDWLAVRKAKNLPPTKTALAGVYRELEKAGMPIPSGIQLCCERGWAGFNPKWLADTPAKSGGAAPWWSSDALILAKGAEMGMKPHNGEYMPSFKGRVQAAIDNGGKPPPPPRANITTFDDGEKDYKKPEGMPSLKSFVKPREAA